VCMTADSADTASLDQIASAGGHVHLYPDRAGVLYIHEKLVEADATASEQYTAARAALKAYRRTKNLIYRKPRKPI